MINFKYEYSVVSSATAKALTPKSLHHVIDIVERMLGDRDNLYTLYVYKSDGNATRIVINHEHMTTTPQGHVWTSWKRVEIYVSGADKSTEAVRELYNGEIRGAPQSARTVYRDWTVPGAKKLEKILYETF